MFSNLYTLYCRKLFAAATNFNRFVVNVAYQYRWFVTCSDNSTRRLVTCIIGSFIISFYCHITQFHCCNVSIRIQKKTKLNKMLSILVMSCNFMSWIFMSCNFMPCNFDGPSFSCPSFSAPRFTVVANFVWPLKRRNQLVLWYPQNRNVTVKVLSSVLIARKLCLLMNMCTLDT